MLEVTYKEQTTIKLSKLIGKAFPEISFTYFNILLKNKDIKINETKIHSDVEINYNDNIKIYANDNKLYKFLPDVVYEDENLIIVNKPRGIETNDSETSYETKLREFRKDGGILACHRLDTNTEGLLIFAKGRNNFEIMVDAFRDKKIIKKYYAVVEGKIYTEKTILLI